MLVRVSLSLAITRTLNHTQNPSYFYLKVSVASLFWNSSSPVSKPGKRAGSHFHHHFSLRQTRRGVRVPARRLETQHKLRERAKEEDDKKTLRRKDAKELRRGRKKGWKGQGEIERERGRDRDEKNSAFTQPFTMSK